MSKSIPFARWPTWNFHFPEKDIKDVVSIKYYAPLALPAPDGQDVIGAPEPVVFNEDLWRFTTGNSGVCGIVFLDKLNLPPLATRPDAVVVEYEP